MRCRLLSALILGLFLVNTSRVSAQTGPLDPAALDPLVATALGQFLDAAGLVYVGDCQTARPVPGAVCTLVYAQPDGSLLVQVFLLNDAGSVDDVPVKTLRIDLPVAAPAAPLRLRIPSIGVDAPIVTLGVDPATNTLDAPQTRDDVGYYDFTPVPGYGGNTVLAGHVDWYTGQPGVFWDLKRLVAGDTIELLLPDGSTAAYQVTDTQLYDSAAAPLDDILGDTATEAVTLITCEGVFDPSAAEYDKRRVVRAERR